MIDQDDQTESIEDFIDYEENVDKQINDWFVSKESK
jgi:hypothetical protein